MNQKARLVKAEKRLNAWFDDTIEVIGSGKKTNNAIKKAIKKQLMDKAKKGKL